MNSDGTDGDGLVFVGASDLAGLVRGKAFPASEWEKRVRRGVGWTPTNVQITCFDAIAESPFGALGDLALIPDPKTRVRLPAEDGRAALDFALGEIRSLEGEPWEFCTRSLARQALDGLQEIAGLRLRAAFEHEFQLSDVAPSPGGYGFRGFRAAQPWAERLMEAMRLAGLEPDTFMKEYGPAQYEVTNAPAEGLRAADDAVLLRMLVQEVVAAAGHSATFAPILDPDGVGNGVHVHMSLIDADGAPATHDPADVHGLSQAARHFIGGILAHLDQILALLAPSDVSYLRLTPHRWSAAFNNLGYRDREASVRICPVSSADPEAIARQYNFEIRACDAAGESSSRPRRSGLRRNRGAEAEDRAPRPHAGGSVAAVRARAGRARIPSPAAEPSRRAGPYGRVRSRARLVRRSVRGGLFRAQARGDRLSRRAGRTRPLRALR